MSDQILKDTLEGTGLPVAYYYYRGTKPEYIVYNEEAEQPANFGSNRAQNRITWWQVHLFAPESSKFREKKKQIIKSLLSAGFYVTDAVTLYEEETRTIHVVISCHMGE